MTFLLVSPPAHLHIRGTVGGPCIFSLRRWTSGRSKCFSLTFLRTRWHAATRIDVYFAPKRMKPFTHTPSNKLKHAPSLSPTPLTKFKPGQNKMARHRRQEGQISWSLTNSQDVQVRQYALSFPSCTLGLESFRMSRLANYRTFHTECFAFQEDQCCFS